MIYTLLDVYAGPTAEEISNMGISILIGLVLVIGLTVYFIKKNKDSMRDDDMLRDKDEREDT